MQVIDDFISFLQHSPTSWHASKELSDRLSRAHFTPLKEASPWNLEPGKGYFVQRGGALAAFRLPTQKPQKALLAASHTDSPALKIKPQPDLRAHSVLQLSTEVYGSPLLHSWLDRDLCLAGQVITAPSFQTHLVHLPSFPLIIPSIAPHLERELDKKGLHIHKQDHLKPISSIQNGSYTLMEFLSKNLSLEKILSADLFLVPLESPKRLGQNQELLASYKLDNLSSVYASLQALIQAKTEPDTLQLAIFLDHEEIGSTSYTGARSNFLYQLLQRIFFHTKLSEEEIFCLMARSLCLSLDATHGFHPNFAEKFDPPNTPYLGKGIALKFHAEQKYATSASSAAFIIELCKEHHIPHQFFTPRSDIPSGSTIGSFLAAQLGISTVDLGVPIWAMHSIRETLAIQDLQELTQLLLLAFNTTPC